MGEGRVFDGSSDRDKVLAKFVQQTYAHHVAGGWEGGRVLRREGK